MDFVTLPNQLVFSGPVKTLPAAHGAAVKAGLIHVPDTVLEDGTVDPSHGLPSYTDPVTAHDAGAPNAGHTPGTLHPTKLRRVGVKGELEEQDNPLATYFGKPYKADPAIGFLTFTGDHEAVAALETHGWQLRAHHVPTKQHVAEDPFNARLAALEQLVTADLQSIRKQLGLREPMRGGAPNTPAWAMQFGSHPAQLARQAIGALLGAGGVVGDLDFEVTQNGTPNMSVNINGSVPGGQIFVPGTTVPGVQSLYYGYNDAPTNLPIAAASATFARLDYAAAQIQDAAYAGGTNLFSLVDIVGTPSGSPVVPSLPASSLPLAEISVAANVTTILTANITSARGQLAFNARLFEASIDIGLTAAQIGAAGGMEAPTTATASTPVLGTPFQPAGGARPTMQVVTIDASGGGTATVLFTMGATSSGLGVTVGQITAASGTTGTLTFPVPAGWWYKMVASGGGTATLGSVCEVEF